MLKRLGVVMVVVADMERSTAFYRDVLGFTVRYASADWTELDAGGVGIGLHPAGGRLRVNPQSGVSIGFYVDDLDATLEALTRRGARVLSREDQGYGLLALIADPDGYQIQICQLKPWRKAATAAPSD